MVSIENLRTFLGKWVYIKPFDDKVQCGVLHEQGGDFYVENDKQKSFITPSQISRLTTEKIQEAIDGQRD